MNKLEEQEKNGKISDGDMDLMTNQKLKFAKTHSELKHYITNFNSLTSFFWSPSTFITGNESSKTTYLGKQTRIRISLQRVPKFQIILHAQGSCRSTEILAFICGQEQTRY